MAAKVTLMLKCQILQQGIKCLQFDTKKNTKHFFSIAIFLEIAGALGFALLAAGC